MDVLKKFPVEEKTINVQNYPLTFKQSGRGFPLILTHTSHAYAKYFLSNLPKGKNNQVLTLDIPGYYHYGRQKNPILTIDLFVDLMALLFDKLQFEKVDLIGECLGSYIVLKFAARYPQKVRKAIALALPLRVFHPKIQKSVGPIIYFLARHRLAGEISKFLLTTPNLGVAIGNYIGGYSRLKDFLKLDRYLFFKRDFDPRVFFGIIADLLKTNPEEIYKKIGSKILFVAGTKDFTNHPKEIQKVSQKIKNSSCVFLPEADHALIENKTEEVNQIVSNFLLR
jgi:pimeloyl-ACP methyl ester carboxylesterase